MSIFDLNLPHSVLKKLGLPQNDFRRQQLRVLRKLLHRARFTEFGQKFRFDEILMSKHAGKKFQDLVPLYDYNSLYKEWWHKTLEGHADVCWPGKIKYYALSSGTSEAASKYLPITDDMLKGNKVVMIKQLLTLRNYDNVPFSTAGKGWLTLSGSTALEKEGDYYSGDLSGITVKKSPFWFQPFYRPGKRIAKEKDWNKKLEEIVLKAPQWDIGFIVGVPAWVQMCMEMIIDRYKLNNIHDIWPNLTIFVHGGVSFQPYKKRFERLLGKPLTYIETYLSSEGFIAYQDKQNANGMRLVTSEHIFMEFIPFNTENFDANGNVVAKPKVLMIHEVEEGKDYALVISTNAGAWRYLIGDTIRFTDKEKCEIIITGRTKHFLNVVGEHLSVDNMNKAIEVAAQELNIGISEFTVAAEPNGSLFSHHWYVASNDHVNSEALMASIDRHLKEINDDYAVERKTALKKVYLDVLSEDQFLQFMQSVKKVGGQHKFPRVLKGKMLDDWKAFVETQLVQ